MSRNKTYLQRVRAAPSEEMGSDLAHCFGTPEQAQATQLISKHQIRASVPVLRTLVKAPSHSLRWSAIALLQEQRWIRQADYVNAWTKDLGETDCGVLRNAVVNLGKYGDHRVIKDIQLANERDRKLNDGPFEITCLGARANETENQILARRP